MYEKSKTAKTGLIATVSATLATWIVTKFPELGIHQVTIVAGVTYVLCALNNYRKHKLGIEIPLID